ncbi:MAG: DUF4923 family protein [Prevotella sp.]|nr:DUF4923 family protein [Prevotella sp.]MDD7274018.1 DUF4923 family protein [Prevotellaceae bacterium]MDY3936409.1 DUF4923 family protein [Prevotella sp.]MDY4217686.1 DUF4923 family protein [Prevotella sp.]
MTLKKQFCVAACAATLGLSSCGGLGSGIGGNTSTSASVGDIVGSVLSSATSGETLGNILSSVIGLDKLSTKNLVGTWRYDGAGCAFLSENALAKAGGEITATEVEKQLDTQFKRLGLSNSNTSFTFKNDATFSAKIAGKSWSGKWSFDEKTQGIKLSGLIININGYVKRNGTGISLLFEATTVLRLLQTIAAASGNTTLGTIGNLSKNYDGMRIGFDLKQ